MLGSLTTLFAFLAPAKSEPAEVTEETPQPEGSAALQEKDSNPKDAYLPAADFEKRYANYLTLDREERPAWVRYQELQQQIAEAEYAQASEDSMTALLEWEEVDDLLAEWNGSGFREEIITEVGAEEVTRLESIVKDRRAAVAALDFEKVSESLGLARESFVVGDYPSVILELSSLLHQTSLADPTEPAPSPLVQLAPHSLNFESLLFQVRYQLAKSYYLLDLTTPEGNTGARIDGDQQIRNIVRFQRPEQAAQALALKILSRVSRRDVKGREIQQALQAYFQLQTDYPESLARKKLDNLLGLQDQDKFISEARGEMRSWANYFYVERVHRALNLYAQRQAPFDTGRDEYSGMEIAAGTVAIVVGVLAAIRYRNSPAAKEYAKMTYQATLRGLRFLFRTRQGQALSLSLAVHGSMIAATHETSMGLKRERVEEECYQILITFLETGIDPAFAEGRYLDLVMLMEWLGRSGTSQDWVRSQLRSTRFKETVLDSQLNLALTGDLAADARIRIDALREATHKYWEEYVSGQQYLTDMLGGQGGNCLAESLLFICALSLAQIPMPEHWQVGAQNFAPNEEGIGHIQAVIYDNEKKEIWSLISGTWQPHDKTQDLNGEVPPPIYPPVYLLFAYLERQWWWGSGTSFQELKIAGAEGEELDFQTTVDHLFKMPGAAGVFSEGKPPDHARIPLYGGYQAAVSGEIEVRIEEEVTVEESGNSVHAASKPATSQGSSDPWSKLPTGKLAANPKELEEQNLDFRFSEEGDLEFRQQEELEAYGKSEGYEKFLFLLNLTLERYEALFEGESYEAWKRFVEDPKSFKDFTVSQRAQLLAFSQAERQFTKGFVDQSHSCQSSHFKKVGDFIGFKVYNNTHFTIVQSARRRAYLEDFNTLEHKHWNDSNSFVLWLNTQPEDFVAEFVAALKQLHPNFYERLMSDLEKPELFAAFPEEVRVATAPELPKPDPKVTNSPVRVINIEVLPSDTYQEGLSAEDAVLLEREQERGELREVEARYLLQPKTVIAMLMAGDKNDSIQWTPKLIEELRELNQDGRYDEKIFGTLPLDLDDYFVPLNERLMKQDGLTRVKRQVSLPNGSTQTLNYDSMESCQVSARAASADINDCNESLDTRKVRGYGYPTHPRWQIQKEIAQEVAPTLSLHDERIIRNNGRPSYSFIHPDLLSLFQEVIVRHPYPQDQGFWQEYVELAKRQETNIKDAQNDGYWGY